jgi:hypothetical protein
MLNGDKHTIMIMHEGTPKLIQDVVRLRANKQALLQDVDIINIQKALIPFIISDNLLEDFRTNPKVQESVGLPSNALQSYLEKPEYPKPDWLIDLHNSRNVQDKELASMIDLIKKHLYEVTPHVLRLIQAINYGDSVISNDLTAAPKHNKQPVTSKFQDVYVTLALTVQNVIQEGLDSSKTKYIVEQLLKEHYSQKKIDPYSDKITKAQYLFNTWWGPGDSKPPFLEHLYLDNADQMNRISDKIGRNKEVIEQYLLRFALPQIQVYAEKLSSTPPYLLDGVLKSIVFSATPGMIELYPVSMKYASVGEGEQKLDNQRYDLGFEASVLETLCQPQNSSIASLSVDSLENTFKELDEAMPGLIKSLCTIIDQGGIFRAFNNKSVIDVLIKYAKSKDIQFTGGIYRKESAGLLSSESGQLMMISAESGQETPLKGSDLKESLKMMGKKFDQVLLATLFDRAITTGADILQPLTAKGLLTIGEGTTKTNTIQAAMRMRKLLLGENGQSIMWLMEKELEKRIPKSGANPLSVQDIFIWMIKNETKLLEKAIVMRGYQGIQHLVRKIAWLKIDDPKLTANERIALYHEYRKGLVDKVVTDPFLTYGVKLELNDTDKVLEKFGLSCAKDLGLNDQFLQLMSTTDRDDYGLIIKQTKELISQLHESNDQMSQEMHQKQEAKQESVQEQQSIQEATSEQASLEPYSALYDAHIDNLFMSNFLSPKFIKDTWRNQYHQLNTLLNFDKFPANIFVNEAFLKIYSTQPDVKIRQIPYILVVQDGNSPPKYLLLTREGADHYKEQLLSSNETPVKGRKAMIVDFDGKLVQNAKNGMKIDKVEYRKFLDAENFKDTIAVLKLLNGKINDLDRVQKFVKNNWTKQDFEQFSNTIDRVHYGKSVIDTESIKEIHQFRRENQVPVLGMSDTLVSENMLQRFLHYIFPTKSLKGPDNAKVLVAAQQVQQKQTWSEWLGYGKKGQ